MWYQTGQVYLLLTPVESSQVEPHLEQAAEEGDDGVVNRLQHLPVCAVPE